MSGYQTSDLHPLTLASISRSRAFPQSCGCDNYNGCHWLCAYHDGYQDGVAALLADIEESLYAEGGFGRRDR